MPTQSGALVSVPLQADDRQLGFLAFSPSGPEGLHRQVHEAARQIARRLATMLTRLEQAAAHGALQPDGAHAPPEALLARIAELEQENARLRESTTELESFVHSVSHDLVAPVRTIRGATQVLADMLRAPHLQREQLSNQASHVDAAAARLAGLVDDLAAYNQLGRMGRRQLPLDLREVVDEALAQLASEIERTGARVSIQGSLPEVLGHHGILVQAVMNLLTNAIKFVGPGVTPEVRIHGAKDTARAWLGVTDNGIGMQEEHADRVFRAFERLHGSDVYPGSGLGLAIVHRGITRLGGHVVVSSTPGQGSTFWIALPRPGGTVIPHPANGPD